MQKYRPPFSALLLDQRAWAAGGDNSLNLTHLKMPDFKVMVCKYTVLIDVRLLHIWQKPHTPTSISLCFLRSSPWRTLGLYLGKASGICSHFWQPAQSSFPINNLCAQPSVSGFPAERLCIDW